MIKKKAISALFLDEKNPRFTEPVHGQDDAITELLHDSHKKMINLAEDIVRQGSLNPSELPIGVWEQDELVVIEGNRRVACLKILKNKELAKVASNILKTDLVKKFHNIAQKGTVPEEVDIFIASSREEARHWIELRHTGENNGVGVLPWEAWQVNNFKRKHGSQTDLAMTFCNAVIAIYSGEDQLKNDVLSVRKHKLTTLGRLISDPKVRENFGFDFKKGELFFSYAPENMIKGIQKIFSDLANNLTVTDIKNKSHRMKYISERNACLPERSHMLDKPESVWNDNLSEENIKGNNKNDSLVSVVKAGSGISKPKDGNSRMYVNREEKVIFEKLKLTNVSDRVRKFLTSSQKISIDDSPQVSAVLIRILLELVITEGIDQGVIEGAENNRLKQKIRNALLKLDPNCEHVGRRNKELEMAWIRTQEHEGGIAVQSMNAFVHSVYADPIASEVRILSKTFRPVLAGIDNLLGAKGDSK